MGGKIFLRITLLILMNISFGSTQSISESRENDPNEYRTFDGTNNNLNSPQWGKANSPLCRFLSQNYGDDSCAPSRAKNGTPLPNVRNVSVTFFPSGGKADPTYTEWFMAFAQFTAHDLSLTLGQSAECCTSDGELIKSSLENNNCFSITIEETDPIKKRQGKENFQCMNFVRSQRTENCEQISAVTHLLDGSQIYGSSQEQADSLREFKSGRLIETSQEYLPPSQSCPESCPKDGCYLAGDSRVNQNPLIAITQTIFMREHNRIANFFEKLNSCWDDEKIYQETRKYIIAVLQHIYYYHWIPILLGDQHSTENQLIFSETNDYVDDYDEEVKPEICNEFNTAAFRYGHSTIAGTLQLFNKQRKLQSEEKLRNNFNCQSIISKTEQFCELTYGLVTQAELNSDRFHDDDVREYLFNSTLDLVAIDIRRGEDHGLASYNDVREFCGLGKASSFEDLKTEISREIVDKLKELYEDVDDIHLFVGMRLENNAEGALVGPTARCILTKQFQKLRQGDRFWYEHKTAGFSLEQLQEIRKVNSARIICENACDKDMTIQENAFEKINSNNQLAQCKNLPEPDLKKWQDVKCTNNSSE